MTKEEFINANIEKLAIDYFRLNDPSVTKEVFIDRAYKTFEKTEKIKNAKPGDLVGDIYPELHQANIILDKVVNITRDYVTLSVNVLGITGQIRFSTQDINKTFSN